MDSRYDFMQTNMFRERSESRRLRFVYICVLMKVLLNLFERRSGAIA